MDDFEKILSSKIGSKTVLFLKAYKNYKRTIDLLRTSYYLLWSYKNKITISGYNYKKEYSFIISSAAKSLEGVLIAIAEYKGMVNEAQIQAGVTIGSLYKDNKKECHAKQYVLRGRDKNLVDKIYGDWNLYRNKSLHYDDNFFVNSVKEAEEIFDDICKTVRLAFKIFIDEPDLPIKRLFPLVRIKSKVI